ncbi:penicillin-binding transpeptidase domain-containing protein [Iodobacter sp. CM08]|uniref:penicillin-binding transpeptidase domain-containing protein n=1 Tax=Iodobacter sp. CM08 TaxID=3085902 RepID=UPI002981DB3C|nr:penicillin-binding transpeptidase domain-containing protein [Iodobacter sp. CM08]MDW5415209.1 penicillin-binding transpeptidase domain-containing protein [Iodobacter sp. CM08]
MNRGLNMLLKKYLLITGILLSMANSAHAFQPDYKSLFKGYDGCFMLYDNSSKKMLSEYNPNNRCSQRIPVNSTFKLPLALMAFDAGLINKDTVFKWNGQRYDLLDWNQDQNPASWEKYSVVWVSQHITPQLGLDKIKQYLADFNYGNQDFSGDPGKNNGLSNAWLSSSLKVSAKEQLALLQQFANGTLPLSQQAMAETKKIIYVGKLNHGADLYGKTGSGWKNRSDKGGNSKKMRDGWYIGLVENAGKQYIFVSNITDENIPSADDKKMGGPIAKEISLKLLNSYFSS